MVVQLLRSRRQTIQTHPPSLRLLEPLRVCHAAGYTEFE